jgi:hypothetical protein
MRFTRSDLPGILIAALAPAGLFLVVIAAYDLWDHHGTPLLPTIAIHLAIGGGVIAVLSRFIRHWKLTGTLIGALLLVAATLILTRQTDNSGSNLDISLRLTGVVLFLLINFVILREAAWYGLAPLLDRRDARRAALHEAEQG